MTSGCKLLLQCIVLTPQKSINYKRRNVNRTMCTLMLPQYPSIYTLNFQLPPNFHPLELKLWLKIFWHKFAFCVLVNRPLFFFYLFAFWGPLETLDSLRLSIQLHTVADHCRHICICLLFNGWRPDHGLHFRHNTWRCHRAIW